MSAQFFTIFDYIAEKAGAKVVKVNPAYTSQLLSYRDEIVFPDCSIREYFDEIEKILVDRDINAAINIKKRGVGTFPSINRRNGKIRGQNLPESTIKQILESLKSARSSRSPFWERG